MNVEVQMEMGKRWSKPLSRFLPKIFEEGTGNLTLDLITSTNFLHHEITYLEELSLVG